MDDSMIIQVGPPYKWLQVQKATPSPRAIICEVSCVDGWFFFRGKPRVHKWVVQNKGSHGWKVVFFGGQSWEMKYAKPQFSMGIISTEKFLDRPFWNVLQHFMGSKAEFFTEFFICVIQSKFHRFFLGLVNKKSVEKAGNFEPLGLRRAFTIFLKKKLKSRSSTSDFYVANPNNALSFWGTPWKLTLPYVCIV